MEISRSLAQQIVEAVKEICRHDINFIDPEGRVFASTDASREGAYHEIGRQAALRRETIEVDRDDSYLGTRRGVNIPIDFNGECIAVIGISGNPDTVRKYAFLAHRITLLLLKEQELDRRNMDRRKQIESFIRTIINTEKVSRVWFDEFTQRYRIDAKSRYRIVMLRLRPRYNPANLPLVEQEIYDLFDSLNARLHTYRYPNEYLLLMTEAQWKAGRKKLEAFARAHTQLLSVAAGLPADLMHMHEPFTTARAAIRSCTEERPLAVFDELDLELLITSVPEDIRARFAAQILGPLDEDKAALLRVYFNADMSLKKTGEQLFRHKNTVQYQLDRVRDLTGYDPRAFRDAVVLYLALAVTAADTPDDLPFAGETADT